MQFVKQPHKKQNDLTPNGAIGIAARRGYVSPTRARESLASSPKLPNINPDFFPNGGTSQHWLQKKKKGKKSALSHTFPHDMIIRSDACRVEQGCWTMGGWGGWWWQEAGVVTGA